MQRRRKKPTIKTGPARLAPSWLCGSARSIWVLWGKSYRRQGLDVTECPELFGQLCGLMAVLLDYFGRPVSDVIKLTKLSDLEVRHGKYELGSQADTENKMEPQTNPFKNNSRNL